MADPWDIEDPWSGAVGAAEPHDAVDVGGRGCACIRVHRLNGELLEVALTAQEASNVVSNRDLKQCLARNDRRDFAILCQLVGWRVFLRFTVWFFP